MSISNVLVTGASGKLGRNLVPALVEKRYGVRAIQFQTPISYEGVEVIKGSISDRDFVRSALENMDAVCHLATSKEDKDGFLDVSVRGTFNLLDESKECGHIKQFLLASGDAAVGILFYPHPYPIDENTPLAAYPGYYALSKIMEETMCSQQPSFVSPGYKTRTIFSPI
jgi:UDP-glucose 4-epimerase